MGYNFDESLEAHGAFGQLSVAVERAMENIKRREVQWLGAFGGD